MLIIIGCLVCIIVPFIPYIPSRHWFFRAFEFVRPQLLFIQLMVLGLFIALQTSTSALHLIILSLLIVSCLFQLIIISPYLPRPKLRKAPSIAAPIKVMVSNVLMHNELHHLLCDIVKDKKPDLLLTLESNAEWERSLDQLEGFAFSVKAPKENTYGMHLYSKFPIIQSKLHYLLNEDVPTLEAKVRVGEDRAITVFGFHPKPPSPTEAETSVSRDLSFRKLAELVGETKGPIVVMGDFNSVAWSKSTRLFIRRTRLTDPRVGSGFHATFHADYGFFRFPIDHLLHSHDLTTLSLKVLPHVGSDHFPLWSVLGFKA